MLKHRRRLAALRGSKRHVKFIPGSGNRRVT